MSKTVNNSEKIVNNTFVKSLEHESIKLTNSQVKVKKLDNKYAKNVYVKSKSINSTFYFFMFCELFVIMIILYFNFK